MAIHVPVIARSLRRGDPETGGRAGTGLPRYARNDAKGFRKHLQAGGFSCVEIAARQTLNPSSRGACDAAILDSVIARSLRRGDP